MIRGVSLKRGEVVVYESGIPFIVLSSGSVSAVGAISGITALPIAYAHAYCWFPANALATTIAAGWHYCTFSTTTAGTAYLNTYTSGVPTVPASPTAVTDGKGAFTGVTGEIFGPTVPIGAGAMGVNGCIAFHFITRWNATAGSRTTQVRFSGNAGTIFVTSALTNQGGEEWRGSIRNRGSESVQIGKAIYVDVGQTLRTAAPVAGAIDTTVATTLVISLNKAVATDYVVMEGASVGVRRAA